jgi:hypothetical protein
MECIDHLFERPRGEYVDYEPFEILGTKGEGRIYHQLSHGRLWNEFQVRLHLPSIDPSLIGFTT